MVFSVLSTLSMKKRQVILTLPLNCVTYNLKIYKKRFNFKKNRMKLIVRRKCLQLLLSRCPLHLSSPTTASFPSNAFEAPYPRFFETPGSEFIDQLSVNVLRCGWKWVCHRLFLPKTFLWYSSTPTGGEYCRLH